MDDGGSQQKRRWPRSKLLMSATLEYGDTILAVTLRDLSAEGAMVESEHDLEPGARIILHKNELAVAGRIAWSKHPRAGIAFGANLDPETVLRHVPSPKARSQLVTKRRPGLRGRMSAEERRVAEELWGGPLPPAR